MGQQGSRADDGEAARQKMQIGLRDRRACGVPVLQVFASRTVFIVVTVAILQLTAAELWSSRG